MTEYDEVPNTSRSTMQDLNATQAVLRLKILRDNNPNDALIVEIDQEEVLAGMTV